MIERLFNGTESKAIIKTEVIQPLWNNYGTLSRIWLQGSNDYPTVIVKQIRLPEHQVHPRGFASAHSHNRKVQSYQVESAWYRRYNHEIAQSQCPTPKCLDISAVDGNTTIVLEDLKHRGFTRQVYRADWNNICAMLDWLAAFHAHFLGSEGHGLWTQGTYWHLSTRPDELKNINGSKLHMMAAFIDARLRTCRYQTLVHGDAKLANFLFRDNGNDVAAVDFQYVGRGCGIQDVAYCVSSCLDEAAWAEKKSAILEHYFNSLRHHLSDALIDLDDLEQEWRTLYTVTCADFHRFMLGWSPTHYKVHAYTKSITHQAIQDIQDELIQVGITAAKSAGTYILSRWKRDVIKENKGFGSAAADIVTEVDIKAQSLILEHLSPTMLRYDLGLLAEEGIQDNSRLEKHAFWTIDPMDGTLFFAQGEAGFAVSIALVSKSGRPLLGIVYDPVLDRLYHTFHDESVWINDEEFSLSESERSHLSFVLDLGFANHPWYNELCKVYQITTKGGAVLNALQLLETPTAAYFKTPKHRQGGCAIWDLAAIQLLIQNAGGEVCTFTGDPLCLNRPDYLYFNDVGFVFTGPFLQFAEFKDAIQHLELTESVYNL